MSAEQQHPITLPRKLMDRLRREAPPGISDPSRERLLAIAAYRAGADAELWACCELLDINGCPSKWIDMLRAARRPKKLPSLKEQALKELTKIEDNEETYFDSSVIRRALEQLDD